MQFAILLLPPLLNQYKRPKVSEGLWSSPMGGGSVLESLHSGC